MTLILFLQVLALVLLTLAAIKHVPENPWIHLGWLGMACWLGALLLR